MSMTKGIIRGAYLVGAKRSPGGLVVVFVFAFLNILLGACSGGNNRGAYGRSLAVSQEGDSTADLSGVPELFTDLSV